MQKNGIARAHTKTIAIIQARVGSTRLPNKVLLDIRGKPMLVWVVERVRRARLVDGVIIATTANKEEDPIAVLCEEKGYDFYRGSHHDLLDRYFQAAIACDAQTIVRVTADCPLIDPGVIDLTISRFYESGADFVANRLPPPWGRTYPIGLDTEVCSFEALSAAWKEAQKGYQREHVMPFIYEQPERFKIELVDHDPDYGHLRWTVDAPEDLELVRQIAHRFGDRDDFSWKEVLEIWLKDSSLAEINANVVHKTMTDVDEYLIDEEE